MVFAINEINENPELLPNITLGFRIYDSCFNEMQAVTGALQLLSGRENPIPNYTCDMKSKVAGLVGDIQSSNSVAVARILGLFRFPQILQYVKRVKVNNSAGQELAFDKNGDQIFSLEYVNWQALSNGETKHIPFATLKKFPESHIVLSNNSVFWSGGYTEIAVHLTTAFQLKIVDSMMLIIFVLLDSTSCIRCPDNMWANEKHTACRLRTFEFLSYNEILGGMLATVSILGSLLPLSILAIFIRNSGTPVVKANNRNLSYLLLLSLCFCYLCALMFIGRPITITCILRQFIFGISFVMCISCVLGKTMMVVIAFNLTQPRSSRRMWLNSRVTNTLVLVCTAIQVIICAGWLAHSPPFQYTDNKSKMGTIIMQCNKGSPIGYSCTMGYMGVLATLCFAIAYLARKLPGSFNEAKLITFSMLIFGAVWISFIPAYLSTTGKYMVAAEVFAILSSSSGLLVCILLPKVYIIIFKPDMNKKDRKIFIIKEKS
ncbi:vomeronasal type-2 receptor 26 [Xenopus tropicalis]|uniref:Vomeronasal type-2 receptor 26 n=1 Tax=Xenopus tropicalis TaxID=8364 RepID=A0A8J1JWX1_XENTR|nr:vomeronasal type-2 receptor 26 [Xenopus tropicalis]